MMTFAEFAGDPQAILGLLDSGPMFDGGSPNVAGGCDVVGNSHDSSCTSWAKLHSLALSCIKVLMYSFTLMIPHVLETAGVVIRNVSCVHWISVLASSLVRIKG